MEKILVSIESILKMKSAASTSLFAFLVELVAGHEHAAVAYTTNLFEGEADGGSETAG